MRINKIALGMLAASAVASSVNAADYYLYGSTAYRKATFDAVKSLFQQSGNTMTGCLGATNTTAGNYTDRSTAAAGSVGDSAWVIWGTLANQGLGSVTVHGTWAGSVGGLARLTHQDALGNTFLATGVAGNPISYMPAHSPDFAMCDSQPDVVSFVAPTPGYSAVHNIPVCVVDFVIAANAGALPANFSNVTFYQLQALYSFGSAPLSLFTGNAADNNKGIYAVGRDDDSGTRTLFALDIGAGIPSTFYQYNITGSGATYAYTYAGSAGINWLNDGAGYSSGGTVKSVLQIANPGTYNANTLTGETVSYAIGYLAVSDWNGSGLPILSYNGVPFSTAAVQEGQYSYWGTENANVRLADWNANLNGIKTFATSLTAAQAGLAGTAAFAGTIKISDMHCTRADDGQVIFHN
jgi:hypothetical protein